VPESGTLISQALAIVEAAKPIKFGDPLQVTLQQSLVLAIFDAVGARDRGYGSSSEVDRATKLARRAGISQEEIDAAITAAAAHS
jgi:hypothetical protein